MSYSLKFEPNYPEYCNIYDRMLCHTLIREILEAMSQSGEDIIIPCDTAGEGVGWFYLIYANGSEGEPMICMSDMSANPICMAIDKKVQRILEEQEL